MERFSEMKDARRPILRALWRGRGLALDTMALAEAAGVPYRSIHQYLGRLERGGWIERCGQRQAGGKRSRRCAVWRALRGPVGTLAVDAELGVTERYFDRSSLTGDPYAKPRAEGKPARRKCLRCGGDFASDGPGNRICGDCRHLNGNVASGLDEPYRIGR